MVCPMCAILSTRHRTTKRNAKQERITEHSGAVDVATSSASESRLDLYYTKSVATTDKRLTRSTHCATTDDGCFISFHRDSVHQLEGYGV